jgi:hypothetical protein
MVAMTFGERIVLIIVVEETRRAGCVRLEGLTKRLIAYLSDSERAMIIADASEVMGEPIVELLDAFVYLLPEDKLFVPVERGFKLESCCLSRVLLS